MNQKYPTSSRVIKPSRVEGAAPNMNQKYPTSSRVSKPSRVAGVAPYEPKIPNIIQDG